MNNLLKMERYQLLHNRVFWGGMIGIFLIGFFTADTYLMEVLGPSGGAAKSLSDIFNGMVYDSTFVLIIVSSILALILGQEFSWRTIDQEICAGHSRRQIFSCKLIVYLIAFNLMAIIYPLAGCIREYGRFGIVGAALFFYSIIKAVVYSLLLNSVVFLIPILCCYCFRNTAKSVGVTAAIVFVLSLYLGYGMELGLPIAFLPIYQIREVVRSSAIIQPFSLIVGTVWLIVLLLMSWRIFRKCDLK
ncbi:ABC transporter permease [Clostridium oryzae]|uniref:ABC-2 family transporter protein n=1 Tax=Clostridium oryzae TaxID=1450648 RepID=A0A1V4IJ47_9CLOT|nr:ABC transporter permease [Clostridium oryzae]OPJ60021.1 ABC-2 family transporter protein [Clostridium oryzae]